MTRCDLCASAIPGAMVRFKTVAKHHRRAMDELRARGISAETCAHFESLMGVARGLHGRAVVAERFPEDFAAIREKESAYEDRP